MGRKVEYFDGKEITKEVIARAREIVVKSDSDWLFSVYDDMTTLEDLCEWNDSLPEDEHIILGNDWLISYASENDDALCFNQWVCVDGEGSKFIQVTEMINALKLLLLANKDMIFCASMRHDTSYEFYKSMIRRGYFEEVCSEIDMNILCSSDLGNFAESILGKYSSFEDYFEMCGFDDLPKQFHKLLFHNVDFYVTDKFVKQYKKK